MSRFLTSLLVALLGVWPTRAPGAAPSARLPRRPRRPSRPETDDAQLPVEATDRERARTIVAHRWPGSVSLAAGERRAVAHGEWRLTFSPNRADRAHVVVDAPALDAAHPERLAESLEALLTLQIPGTRLTVTHADDDGWRQLELRVPSAPETIVQLDRASLAHVLGASPEAVRLTLHVQP